MIVEYLLNKGANPNLYTNDNLSALKSAAKHKSSKIVQSLLKAGAEPNYEKNGDIALTLACDDNENDVELVRLLLPVSDKSFYQKAYEYSTSQEIRDLIKAHAPEMQFTEPADGFGGPNYRTRVHYETPPDDPLLAKIWKLLNLYVDLYLKHPGSDPNDIYEQAYPSTSMCDDPKQFYRGDKLHLSKTIIETLQQCFSLPRNP